MTVVPRARPFDISLIRSSTPEAAYIRGRECLRAGPVQALSWEWMGGALFATGQVRDPAGNRFAPGFTWDGNRFKGRCTCPAPPDELCAHRVALALQVLRANPWRQDAPVTWRSALDLALPQPEAESGDQRFVYRLEVRSRPGDPIGRLRLRLSRARVGKRGIGRETPFPASRLKGVTLDTLHPDERALIGWLLPLQGWMATQTIGYTGDPRFFDVPPALVDSALRTLAALPLSFFGEHGEVPLQVSPTPLYFSLTTEPVPGGAFRLGGRLTEVPPESVEDPSGLEPFYAESLVGERPSFALIEGVFYPVRNLDRAELWARTCHGDVEVPMRDLRVFLESYAPALRRSGMLTAQDVVSAIPEAVTGLTPTPVLTLEEEGGLLVALLTFRYGTDFTVPAGGTREVEELELRGRRLLLHRDRALEATFEEALHQTGLQATGAGRFEASADPALEFLLHHLPPLLEAGWVIEGEERLERYRPSRSPVRVRGAITTGVNWFELQLEAVHGDETLPMSEVFKAWQSGRRFVRFGNGEHAMLPEAWLNRNRALLNAILGDSRDPRLDGDEDDLPLEPPTALDEPFRAPLYLAPLLEGLRGDESEIDADPEWSRFAAALKHFGELEPSPLPGGLQADLRAYQRKGIDWLCFLRDHGLGGILADDMGLGKTLQALTLLLLEKDRLPHHAISLVVTPTSVVFNWAAEAKRFAPDLKVVVLHGPERHAAMADAADADLVVTSYALLRRDLPMHLEREYHYVILDEAQWVKNPDSQTALAARSLRARHKLTLTGTPIENRLAELWSQFAFLMPGLFPGLRRFMSDYVLPIERNNDLERQEELRRRIYPFVLRRLKEEVASELPPRTDNVLYCELDGAQRRLYQTVLKASRDRVRRAMEEKGAGRARITVLDALLKLRQICCHPGLVHLPEALGVEASAKLELFKETLLEILSEGHRVLVFSQFVEMLTVLRELLEAHEVTYEYLDGRTRDRQARVDRFNAGSAPVFLISLKAGGTGLNLASADYVIHYDPWWNPAVEDQATDRAYRIGQTRPVFSYKLIARDTVEEKILILQHRKRDLARGLLNSEGGIEKVLTPEDFEFLFEDPS